MDIHNPNGLGRRRRSFGQVEAVPLPESLKRRRNFFPISETEIGTETETVSTRNETSESEERSDDDKSAKIDDNVALTVVIPGGKNQPKKSQNFVFAFCTKQTN